MKIIIKYVEYIPSDIELEENTLYISEKYKCIVHKCFSGCGEKVVMGIGENSWKITKNNEDKITIRPSVGNWNLPCKSHYYITDNKVEML